MNKLRRARISIPKPEKISLAEIPRPEIRLREIFPCGFDPVSMASPATSGACSSKAPNELYHALLDCYDPEKNVQKTVVTMAWYGKEERRARHEFLLLQVEDKANPGLCNYMVVDRNQGQTDHARLKTVSSIKCRSCDDFKISNDGDYEKLLQACDLDQYALLERIIFSPEEPLFVYELVALVLSVSENYEGYHPFRSNCFLFAGMIWECMVGLRPQALHQSDAEISKLRGRFGKLVFNISECNLSLAQSKAEDRIVEARKDLEKGIKRVKGYGQAVGYNTYLGGPFGQWSLGLGIGDTN